MGRASAVSWIYDPLVRILALHRHYERTCDDCGYHWAITRREAQYRVNTTSVRLSATRGVSFRTGIDQSTAWTTNVDSQSGVSAALHRCARCGGEHCSDRPITRRRPATPLDEDSTSFSPPVGPQ